MSWVVPSAGGPCPSFAVVIPIVGGKYAYMVDDSAPAVVCDTTPIVVVDGNAMPSNFTITSSAIRSAQFVTVAPLDLSGGDVDFCVKVDDNTPLYVYDPNPLFVPVTVSESP